MRVETTILEEVVPMGGVLIEREGDADALEMRMALANPTLPRFVRLDLRALRTVIAVL